MTPVRIGMAASGGRFMFGFALIRAIVGAAARLGTNADVEIDLGFEGGSEAVGASPGAGPGPGAGSANFPDRVKT
jgi:hypothetical protein